MPEHLSDEYHGELLYVCLKKANQLIKTIGVKYLVTLYTVKYFTWQY